MNREQYEQRQCLTVEVGKSSDSVFRAADVIFDVERIRVVAQSFSPSPAYPQIRIVRRYILRLFDILRLPHPSVYSEGPS